MSRLSALSGAVRRCAGAAALALAAVLFCASAASVEPRRPTLFLSCPQGCFEDYLRQQLSYFDLVRDRNQADWTLFMVRQVAAHGGQRTTLTVLPRPTPPSPPEPEGGASSIRGDRDDPMTLSERNGLPVCSIRRCFPPSTRLLFASRCLGEMAAI